ncbi:putative ATP-dependent DNA helicase RecQ [Halomicronema hongdechloris C2206]|uniref:DNA 3'-5' helicase n=1 Tax=Halomicronema hongdechloris C2206 TaxID=1641165 RepID=A0A1Z3HG87_9CYAN|nr:DEAD/DEAH box helicase [Halomicronema hongdechloris]ASC69313.1 putative ATP-dependent DNA helicase RecQ [Halomicronema hongdechloris C2206]
MSDLQDTALQLLRTALDNPTATFRDNQWEAIEQLLNPGTRLLMVQRTGWGKSLIYFLTTRLLRNRGMGPTLLISPLLALMRNQIAAAERIGLQAVTINSTNQKTWRDIQEKLLAGQADILLISPERLANEEFQEEILLPLSTQNGLSVSQLEGKLNLSRGKIEKVLTLLSVEAPSPVTKINGHWHSTPINYEIDREKVAKLTEIRKREQARMLNYINTYNCLILFLAEELDDNSTTECGRCAVCLDQSLIPETYSLKKAQDAISFLRRTDHTITPRKRWPAGSFISYSWSGNIPITLQAETGLALSLWGDAGWGSLVKQGKYQDKCFNDQLVDAVSELIQCWKPDPFPTWITCVPSLTRPELVPNFSERLARKLNLPFISCVRKIRRNHPQKDMQNSVKQAQNLDGVFEITSWQGIKGPVFLVDDMVDSRWTFTVVTALLHQSGSGRVFPLALALNSLS